MMIPERTRPSRADVHAECFSKRGFDACELAPAGVQPFADQRNRHHPGRRERQAFLQQFAHMVDQIGYLVGVQRGDERERQYEYHGDQQRHQERGEVATPFQTALEKLVYRPGRKTQDGRRQDPREKRPEHHHAADHEQHDGRDLYDLFVSRRRHA